MIRRKPVVIMGIVSMVFCILHRKTNYVVIPMPAGIGYHINILKINAVFSVAALINMLLMLRTSEKKFIKKLEETDILKEKNCIIGQCIVFGSISIFISTVWSLKIQMDFVAFIIGKELFLVIKEFLFYVESMSFIVSIFYFLLSVYKTMQLLDLLYIPKERYSSDEVRRLQKQIIDKEK